MRLITKFDSHSLTHCFGSTILFLLFYSFEPRFMFAGSMTFGLGIIWEYFDECTKNNYFNIKKQYLTMIFDIRGGDYFDLMYDFLGVVLGCVLIKLLFGTLL